MTTLQVAFAVLTAACGGVAQPATPDPDAALEDGNGPTGNPAITSISPADGAVGVAADAKIVVVFDAAMDQATVEAAWQSTDLPPANVTFAWDTGGTMLTVTPTAPLELNEGAGLDPSAVVARTYTFRFADTAKDLEGRVLAAPVTSSFSTSRRLRVALAAVTVATRSMRSDGVVFGEAAVTMTLGDTTGNLQTKTYVTFGLVELPTGATLETATLRGSQNSTNGTPYALGAIQTLHTNVAVIDGGAFGTTPLANLGAFSNDPAPGGRSIDVTTALADDLANHQARGERTQYRLEFPTAVSANAVADEARFSRSGFGLTLAYLID